jgi:flagellar motility protein MotE (MotC chaperone)
MLGHIRVLPVLIGATALLFFVKVGGLWVKVDALGGGISEAHAQQTEIAGDPLEQLAAGDEAEAMEMGGEQDLLGADEELQPFVDLPDDPTLFTKSEIEVLQSLSLRRKELEERDREMDMRANLLRITETRVEERIAELKKIETQIEALLKRHDEEREAKFKRLVKVYENMKPKDAARIFNIMEMKILLEMVERMKEAKMAPILAKMNGDAAKALTIELANRRRLPDPAS